jgi:hypothetical protein
VEPPPVEDDPMVTFRLFRLQEPEAPFNNATSRVLRRGINSFKASAEL